MKKTFWLLPLLAALPLFAVTPVFWEVRTYDDFRRGTLTNVSLTSEDRLILAPRFDLVFDTEQTFVWSAAADSKGSVYLGTGHDGKVYKVDSAGKGALFADLPELDVFALAVDSRDVLYAATSPDGKVYKIDGAGQPQSFFDPDAKYIWALAFDRQGRLIVGTGDRGVIYRVGTDGKGEPFYDTDETHVISLALDRDGNVIAGGDPKGYVYRISPDGKAFVLYDSGMREVHALTVAADGTIYAAVVSSRPGLSASSLPTLIPDGASGGAAMNVTITLGSESAAQSVDVVESAGDQPSPSPSGSSTPRSSSDAGSQSAILELKPDGAVTTVWRSTSELVYSILTRGNRVYFSTGTKGRIYSLENSRDTTLLVESTEDQTTRLLDAGNRVYAASSNAGKLFSLTDVLSSTGTYESIVRDTDAISSWGKLAWIADNPELIQFFTRSGNTGTPDRTWSDWVRVGAGGAAESPKARFLQWRAVLRSDAGRTPSLNSVTVPYLPQNMSPEISSIDVLPSGVSLIKMQPLTAAGTPAGPMDAASTRANARAGLPGIVKVPPRRNVQKGAQSFQWIATDKNQDALRYDLFYRGESERTWIPLKKDLEDTFYTINSDTLPDGQYIVKLVASDALSNSSSTALTAELETKPFSIDNTPPTATMKQEGITGGRVRVAIEASDPTSTLNQPEISVDAGEWRALFPQDGITDSKAESFEFQSDALPAGEHVIAFRIYDQNDNVGMAKLVVRLP